MNDVPQMRHSPTACRRHVAGTALMGVICWLIAALAAAAISMIPYDFGESICGAWGCFPPIQALVSVHFLWSVALAGGLWILNRLAPGVVRPVGWISVIWATLAIGVLLTGDLPRWLDRTSDLPGTLWPKRVGYLLATETDLPLIQAVVAGLVAVVFGRRNRGRCPHTGVLA